MNVLRYPSPPAAYSCYHAEDSRRATCATAIAVGDATTSPVLASLTRVQGEAQTQLYTNALRDFSRQCAASPSLFVTNCTLSMLISSAVDASIANVVQSIAACQNSGDRTSALRIVDTGFKLPLYDLRAEAGRNNGSVAQVRFQWAPSRRRIRAQAHESSTPPLPVRCLSFHVVCVCSGLC